MRSNFSLAMAICATALGLVACAAPTAQQRSRVSDISGLMNDRDAADESAPSNRSSTLNANESQSQTARSSSGTIPAEREQKAVYHFSMGQAYSLNNEVDSAIEEYRTTLAYDPNSALVRARLAAELVKKGEFQEAKTLCEEAIRLDETYIDAYLLLAGVQVVAKELEAAIETYRLVLRKNPDHRDTLLYYGTTLAESGKLSEAEKTLARLVRLEDDPESQVDEAVAWYYLAKVQTQLEKFSAASESLRQSLQVRPSYSRAALFLADLYIAEDQPEKAIQVMEASFNENPAPTLATRLAAYYLSVSDFQKAVPYLELMAEVDSENISAKVRLALVYWQIDWLVKAFNVLYEVHKAFPASNEVLYYLGELELERKQPDSAISFFGKVDPSYGRYEESVARVVASYQERGDVAAAKKFVKIALTKRDDIVSFYTMYGRLLEAENKVSPAIRFLEQNLKKIDKDESALYYLGYLYDQVGQAQQGLTIMQKILETNPDNANALNYVGYTMLEQGEDLDKAGDYLKRALAIKPNDPYILDSYGWLLFRQGNAKEALVHLERAAELKPTEGVILEHMADVYLQLNLKQKALAMYEKALSTLPNTKDQVRVQGKISDIETILGMREPQPPRQPASGF